jgi:hypothetical protein
MVGRMAYNTPWDLVRVDRELYGDTEDSKNREQLLTVKINNKSLWFNRNMRNIVSRSRMSGWGKENTYRIVYL